MSIPEITGYVATALNVAGNLMLTRMNVWGWIVRLLVNVLYVIYAVQIESGGPMVVNHVVFMSINIEGWRKWKRMKEVSP
jgi:nicotinamide riboside transporter PnuC